MSLDLCIAVTSPYFLIFAGLAFALRGMPFTNSTAAALLSAARFGPTIFLIMFAAIIGRALKATAAFKLERGASVGSLEYLLGSQTVFSAIATLVELRTSRFLALCLIVLWALSPIGSQASSRVVSAESRPTNVSATLQYLDVDSPFTMSGADEGAELGPAVRGVFDSALTSSESSKEAPEDAFSNIKIPMPEVFAGQGAILDDTWYDTSKPMGNSFSSILGLPLFGVASEGSSYFDLETSYMYTDCSVTLDSSYQSTVQPDFDATNVSGSASFQSNYLTIVYGASHGTNSPLPPVLVVYDTGQKGLTTATCALTTTFVEASIQYSGRECSCKAARKTVNNRNSTALTVWDYVSSDSPLPALLFFEYFVGATGTVHAGYSDPLEVNIVHPESPYSFFGELVDMSDVGDALFSQSFTRTLNTFWIAGIAPFAVTGNFFPTPSQQSVGTYGIASANGLVQSSQTVLHCDMPWLIMLVLTSAVALLAGLATMLFDVLRSGPDILGHFASSLRGQSYARIRHASSMESGPATARRLKGLKVSLCDVEPYKATGHVAIATLPGNKAASIQAGRLYS
ncbi:hypothetical protein LTR49_025844 [Elasticomyces elasticus]|nr:hypothetical protein LTR49_025844 [Elasticomyces elasticus]